jgi:hypothetical protein
MPRAEYPVFYCFPANTERRKKWIRAIGLLYHLSNIKKSFPYYAITKCAHDNHNYIQISR